ncbi:MAG: hypothetical protein WCG47_27890 [Dermatophilaceae bacterium]
MTSVGAGLAGRLFRCAGRGAVGVVGGIVDADLVDQLRSEAFLAAENGQAGSAFDERRCSAGDP